jgi:limonene-1,2-epoxide hydrolase
MATSNEEVLRAVLTAWGAGLEAAAAATREHFADDCVWEQTALPTTTGPEEAAQMMLSMQGMGFSGIDVEFRNVVASGDVVCTERVDWLVRPDGTRVGPWPVVGVTEFRNGKISSWREYFDSANLAQLGGE